MSKKTTIQIEKKTAEKLMKLKENPRQTYNQLITKMADVFKNIKKNDQYDKFLHEIQKPKMKELWNNKEDEAWENA